MLTLLDRLAPVEVYETQATIGRLIANPKRIEILYHLKDGEKNVAELLEIMDLSKTNLSQHLAVLRTAGILRTRREGSFVFYRLASEKISQACNLMREALTELAMV